MVQANAEGLLDGICGCRVVIATRAKRNHRHLNTVIQRDRRHGNYAGGGPQGDGDGADQHQQLHHRSTPRKVVRKLSLRPKLKTPAI